MPADTLTEELDQHIEELETHLNAAPERIKAYYRNKESPDGFSEFEEAPHMKLIRRGTSVIEFVYEYDQENPGIEIHLEWGKRDLVVSHIGIGLEMLLAGIHMKTAPEDFIAKLQDNNGKMPDHGKTKGQVMNALPESLSNSQRKQISRVIDVVRKKRNNTVHSGLHAFYRNGLKLAYYEVCAYLIMQFSEDFPDIVKEIEEYRRKIREGPFMSGAPPENPLPLASDIA